MNPASTQNTNRKILVVTYWSYNDALIQTYVLPYLKIIRSMNPDDVIYLVTFNKKNVNQSTPVDPDIQHLPFTYSPFGIVAMAKMAFVFVSLLSSIQKKKITHIHTWCTPAGAVGFLLKKMTGRKLIIDSFEPHAEPMQEGNTWKKNSIAYRLLMRLEKSQLKAADEVICTVDSMREYSQKTYGIIKKRYFVKPACVDLERFNPETAQAPKELENELRGKIVCVYAGKFGGLYLERETFDFIRVAAEKWGDKFRFLLLSSHSQNEIEAYCRISGVNQNIVIHRFVPYAQVADFMKLASFGICPMKPLPSRRFSTPIKNGEYWAMGLPVVITKNISDDSTIIEQNNAGYVLNELNEEEYENALQKIETLLEESQDLLRSRIRKLAETYRNFSIAGEVYHQIYNSENFGSLRKN